MNFLVRVLSLLVGVATAFAGYFIMAAEGWPEPLEHMFVERSAIGGSVALLGAALCWSAFKPTPRRRVSAPPASAAPEPEVYVAPEAAVAEAPPVGAEDAQPHAVEVHTTPPDPIEHEPATDAAPANDETRPIADLLAAGDRLHAEGRLDDALDSYAEALDLARAAHAAHPDDADAARTLAGALKSNGDVHDEEGRLDTAIELYEEALGLNRTLVSTGAPADRRRLSLVLERLGDCREARGHRSRAADLYRESLGIGEGLVRDDPGNPLYAEDLAATQARIRELEDVLTPA
jgi:exonuclease VII small subunit